MSRHSATPALPGYEIQKLLGSGGTSTVWLARQLSLDRMVAIKILSPALLAKPTAREQFQKEARAAARLSLSTVVGIVDFGEHDGTLYYVMEYVAGTNLAEWLQQNSRMAHAQALKLVKIIAEALESAWKDVELIHCDIKPGNILLGSDGAVKLTDLGLARIAGVAATRPSTESIEGTPTYIAPEQIEGYEPDFRSDIYSLGLTLYHLLTGHPPFEGRTLEEVLQAQQNDFLPDPCESLPNLPVGYGWLLTKMTAKDPSKRPTSWAQVLKDIQRIQAGKAPLPPYPADDESTIALQPRHRPSARASTINLSAAVKKSIALSGTEKLIGKQKRSTPSLHAASASAGGGFLRFVLFILFVGGVLAALWFFLLKDNADFQAIFKKPSLNPDQEKPNVAVGGSFRDSDSARDDTTEDSGTGESAATTPRLPEIIPPAVGTGTVTPGSWYHPGFIQAAQLFNKTLAAYQTQLKSKEPANSAFVSLVADAQYAAQLFEILKTTAPVDVPVKLYANQCYQLVNDLRRARLTLADKKNNHAIAPKSRHATLAPYPTPPRNHADPFSPRFMQFGYAWDTLPAPVDRPETPEFVFLLSTVADPSADTRAQAGLVIQNPLTWLMPLGDACRALGVQLTEPRTPLEGAPFPYGGFFMHTFGAGRLGAIGPGQPPYPTLRLITDSDDQLVAVQLVDEKPSPPLQSSPLTFNTASKIEDFVTGRALPTRGDVRASHRTLKGDGTLRIDSEAADFTDGPNGKPLFRSILLLPQPVANNLLYHLLGSRD